MQYLEHSNLLLQRHRCGYCAESVSLVEIIRVSTCKRCGTYLHWQGSSESSNLFGTLQSKWTSQKWMILLLVTGSSLFAGQIPMLQSLIMIIGIVGIHIILIRQPLKWLPAKRRIFAKLSIKLIGVMITMFNFFINVLIWPFFFVNGVVLAVLALVNTLAFVHLSMKSIEKRLRWEQEQKAFGFQDWIGPVIVLSTISFITTVGVLIVYVVGDWMLSLPVPLMEMNVREYIFGTEN